LSSAKSFFELGKRLVIHQWSPYSLILRESGYLLLIRWCLQELREPIDAIQLIDSRGLANLRKTQSCRPSWRTTGACSHVTSQGGGRSVRWFV